MNQIKNKNKIKNIFYLNNKNDKLNCPKVDFRI